MGDINIEILQELNGSIYLSNESGETDEDLEHYTEPIATGSPGSDAAALLIADIKNLKSVEQHAIGLNAQQIKQFLGDQTTYLRAFGNIAKEALEDNPTFVSYSISIH